MNRYNFNRWATRNFFTQILMVLFGFAAFAQSAPSISNEVNDPRWQRLLEVVSASQIKTQTRVGVYITEQRIIPNDPTQERIASYISVFGDYSSLNDGSPFGLFHIEHLEVVWEHWEKDIPADLWRLDQWTFRIKNDGTLLPNHGRHNRGTRALTRARLGVGDTVTIPTDEARLQQRWKELKAFWLEELAPVTIQK